jgi:hypothetical protein
LLLCYACLIASTSCARARAPLALDSQDPSHDARQIAAYYVQEAMALHRKAEDVSEQAAAYERLFGRDSEWATGARLLAQYYEEEAKEKHRMAGRYLGTAGGRAPQAGLMPR